MTENTQEIRHIVRIFNTDVDGNKQIIRALLKVHGISFSIANAICNLLKLDKTVKAGLLNEKEIKNIESVINENKLPVWMLNNRLDFITGETKHLLGSDLKFNIENTLKRMKRLKFYKGMRHSAGQPVRGQRTRAHFRKGSAVGVKKVKVTGKAT